VDRQSRSRIRRKKRRRDRLIALAARHADWLVGFADETWWSREARPALHAWTATGQPLRLVEVTVPAADPAPKALACYGVWLPECDATWLRFVDGRPVSEVTMQFLAWCAQRAAALGKTTLVLIWDRAGWHLSRRLWAWLRQHNQAVQRTGGGVRIIPCLLPKQSPWLNPIEPKWIHGKRRIIEPDRLLSLEELEDRVCDAFACPRYQHLAFPKNVC
jgi:transposase